MLKSQKCSRWEAEGEREETLQKLQVMMADLGHLCTWRRETTSPLSLRVNVLVLPNLTLPLDDGDWSMSMSVFLHPICVPQRCQTGCHQRAVTNPTCTCSPLPLAVDLAWDTSGMVVSCDLSISLKSCSACWMASNG